MDSVTLIRVVAGLLFLLVVLGVPAIAAIIIAKDANARGMNGVGWGIGVFLLFILFLPVYLTVRKPIMPRVPDRAAPALLCANCGKYSAPGGRFCPSCGQEFASDVPSPLPVNSRAIPVANQSEQPARAGVLPVAEDAKRSRATKVFAISGITTGVLLLAMIVAAVMNLDTVGPVIMVVCGFGFWVTLGTGIWALVIKAKTTRIEASNGRPCRSEVASQQSFAPALLCSNCGKYSAAGAQFCSACGAAIQPTMGAATRG